MNREMAHCYYFTKNKAFSNPEDTRIDYYIDHWKLRSLIECDTLYIDILTRVFYANFVLIENPISCTTYVCGKLINLVFGLGLENTGTEEYVHKKWPSQPPVIGIENDYRRWFNRDQPFESLYTTYQPFLHCLAHMFINNILTPKAKIKTNLEYSGLFYLCHLITLDDLDLHIPYIIICHMRTTYIHTQHSLPYGHVIQRFLEIHDIPILGDQDMLIPPNLCWELTNLGWIEKRINKISHLIANDRRVNKWTCEQNALPNQFWDPNSDDAEVDSSAQGEPSQPLPYGDTMS